MIDDFLHLNVHEIPNEKDLSFRNIVHATSLKNAQKILSSGEIFGDFYKFSENSKPIHANFFIAERINFDLAKSCEVLLYFQWCDEQYATASHMIGKHGDSTYKNVLFHVYSSEAEDNFDFHQNYWQSIIFPGSDKLNFVKLIPLKSYQQFLWFSSRTHTEICRLNKDYSNKRIHVI